MTDEPRLSYTADLIEYQGRTLGEKPFILFEDQKVSFAEFDRATSRAANGLAARGASPGDGMAILMTNCPEYLFLFYGMPRGGFYSVPVNTALKGDGLRFILTHSDVKYLVVDDTLYPKVTEGMTSRVEYYKDPEAGAEEVKDGWILSGDLFYADKDNNLFFVDRKTDSICRRGENISSWEVENIVRKHPAVAECAAFGVPSALGEDEVMIWVAPKEGVELELKELMRFLVKNMACFMVPRYVDVVDDIQQTGTMRIQKVQMKKQGVTARTWDREKEMPELELKRS